MGCSLSSSQWEHQSSSEKLCQSSDYPNLFVSHSSLGVCAPVVGYEVMKKRKKHTVYKLHIMTKDKSWFVFRTFEDFLKVDKQLHKKFPSFCVKLPRRGRENKYSKKYLHRMQRELHIYFDVLMHHDKISNSDIIKDFLQFVNPPGHRDNIEQCEAYCEEMECQVADLNEKIKGLEHELNTTQAKLGQTLLQQKTTEVKLEEEMEKKRFSIYKSENENRILFPKIVDVKSYGKDESSII